MHNDEIANGPQNLMPTTEGRDCISQNQNQNQIEIELLLLRARWRMKRPTCGRSSKVTMSDAP